MKRIFYSLIISFFLTACVSNTTQHYAPIDLKQKTIKVPAGSIGLKGKIKSILFAQGWNMSVYSGPSVTKKTLGKSIRYDEFNTRYTLALAQSIETDGCLVEDNITYELSFIDNKSGSEVFTMNGDDCESLIADEFRKTLREAANSQ